jgi:competence protein ComEC
MRKLFFIFLLSSLFFHLTLGNIGANRKKVWQKGLPQVAKYLIQLELKRSKSINDKNTLNLWSAYLWGKTRKLSKNIVEAHAQLHLQHLFSPSGLHLSLLQTVFPKILFPLLLLGSFTLPLMMALKRMALIKFAHRFFPDYRFIIFLICMLIELIASSFNLSLSFCYSFLFLGIIYSNERWHLSSLLYWIFMGNLFCHMILAKSFSIVGFLLGQIILIIFTPLFLVQTLNLALPWSFLVSLLKEITSLYLWILVNLSAISTYFPSFIPNSFIFISFLCLLSHNTRKFSYFLFLINAFELI